MASLDDGAGASEALAAPAAGPEAADVGEAAVRILRRSDSSAGLTAVPPPQPAVALRNPARAVFGNALLCRQLLLACVPSVGAWSAVRRTTRCAWGENTRALRSSVRTRISPAGRAVIAVTAAFGLRARAEFRRLMELLDGLDARPGLRAADDLAVFEARVSVASSCYSSYRLTYEGWALPGFLAAAAEALAGAPELAVLAAAAVPFFEKARDIAKEEGRHLPDGLEALAVAARDAEAAAGAAGYLPCRLD
ncbi:hypothetical protein DFJ74DRAFT_239909 [Hyaloraphidium curvatum]|nr:hypothetical protein DFJ74DRAFT_239909 [Hyaloraphidium curvatum]